MRYGNYIEVCSAFWDFESSWYIFTTVNMKNSGIRVLNLVIKIDILKKIYLRFWNEIHQLEKYIRLKYFYNKCRKGRSKIGLPFLIKVYVGNSDCDRIWMDDPAQWVLSAAGSWPDENIDYEIPSYPLWWNTIYHISA